MKYKRFEELPVWQAAMTLCERVFSIADDKAFGRKGDLRSQLQRAAISVANNIAEGFERGTTQELLTFLYIARGSAGEVRSMLLLAERLRDFDHLKSEISISNRRPNPSPVNSAPGPTVFRTPISPASVTSRTRRAWPPNAESAPTRSCTRWTAWLKKAARPEGNPAARKVLA